MVKKNTVDYCVHIISYYYYHNILKYYYVDTILISHKKYYNKRTIIELNKTLLIHFNMNMAHKIFCGY